MCGPPHGPKRLTPSRAVRITLNASTMPCASVLDGSCAKLFYFPSAVRCMKPPSIAMLQSGMAF